MNVKKGKNEEKRKRKKLWSVDCRVVFRSKCNIPGSRRTLLFFFFFFFPFIHMRSLLSGMSREEAGTGDERKM